MRGGQLRHRVQIQFFTEKQNETTGDMGGAWETVGHRWASVKPLRGEDFFAAHQVQSILTHRITMRGFTGINNKHRILFQNRHFNIHGVINVGERNKQIELMCTEDTSIPQTVGGPAGDILS